MRIPLLLAILTLGTVAAPAEDKAAPDPAVEAARTKFAEADALLNKVFKETCADLDKEETAALKKKEAAWEKFRDTTSAARAQHGDKKMDPKLSADYWASMESYDRVRINFLQIYTGKGLPKGISGEYTDCQDGDLELDETKDGINFTLSVVRGGESHTGQISGTAVRKGNTAHFKQQVEPGQKGKPCELVFTFSAGHIVKIEEVTPDPDAEAGVHYDGDYYKKAGATGNNG